MIRKAAITGVFCLGLASCQSGGSAPDVGGIISQVQNATTQICRFVPAAATVSALLNLGLSDITTIAQQICGAISKPSAVRGQHPQVCSGARCVAIVGRRV